MSDSSTNTLGRYQIVREIARSNDIVYEAIDPSINRRVALKELSIPPNVQGAQRRERVERFWREGKAAGRLSHPNIVTVYEVGKDDERHYIAMEFLEGQTLRDSLQAGGPMQAKAVEEYVLQLCSALSYAHQHGVVHRDIKPENVQILPGGHVKLTDFGIARLMGEPSITQNGQVFGTPSYMSPEQVAGKELDARSDIFSVGVLLYEMLAGKKPFTGDTIVTITYNIVNMEAPPPAGAPPYMAAIIRKAMAKDASARYQSADDLAQDIREHKCSDVFLPDATSAGAYPSPFGGATQPQPMVNVPGAAVPDPFAQNQPLPSVMAPSAPRKPMVSAETRNFLGIFLLTLGAAGMLVFAVWAVNLAYNSYVTAQTSGAASKYYEQGRALQEKGDLDGAERQYLNAIQVSPKSKAGKQAEDGVYSVWVARGYNASNLSDKTTLTDIGKKMIELRPKYPEGHYYLGVSHELSGEMDRAIREYDKADVLAGNDEQGYGKAARDRAERLRQMKPPASEGGDTGGQKPTQPRPRDDDSGVPYEPGTQ